MVVLMEFRMRGKGHHEDFGHCGGVDGVQSPSYPLTRQLGHGGYR